ncbi:low molecular weight phosphatase family protein [Nocardia sp. NPDC051570]|uniref:arsenate reductase/protein-tyrosine-phosphatase family protein n=1 Tax=Nocardia sp. NPDC051570 TaxID=3364324 RepID=UPI0037B17A7A
MHVLFVCTGNVCRSVIAERLTRAMAAEHGMPDLTAESAGTRALVGFGVEPHAAQTIAGLGADAGEFKARKLKPEMIERADLVLTMSEQIRDEIMKSYPAVAARTFTLLEAHRIAKVSGARTIADIDRARNDLALVGRENIADPVGLSAEKYCEVGDRIAEALVPLLLALHIHEGHSGTDERGRPRLVVLTGGRSEPPPLTTMNRLGRHA